MKQDRLKETHENVETVIADIAEKLADPASDMVVPLERDMAIMMACASITKSELATVRDGTTRMDHDLMKTWMNQIAELAKTVGGNSGAEILGRLAEMSYEFDEDLSAEYDKAKESVEAPPEEHPDIKPVADGDAFSGLEAPAATREELRGGQAADLSTQGAAGVSVTTSGLERNEAADGSPIDPEKPVIAQCNEETALGTCDLGEGHEGPHEVGGYKVADDAASNREGPRDGEVREAKREDEHF